jgi:hypothetical protein
MCRSGDYAITAFPFKSLVMLQNTWLSIDPAPLTLSPLSELRPPSWAWALKTDTALLLEPIPILLCFDKAFDHVP